eukprot:SAG31_NODE_14161_length_824_cov_1.028966_1_plen_152_part_00
MKLTSFFAGALRGVDPVDRRLRQENHAQATTALLAGLPEPFTWGGDCEHGRPTVRAAASEEDRRAMGDPDEEFLEKCSICLGEFEHGELVQALPTCTHIFHPDCIQSWLRVRHTCPLCVTAVRSPDAEPTTDSVDEPQEVSTQPSSETTTS